MQSDVDAQVCQQRGDPENQGSAGVDDVAGTADLAWVLHRTEACRGQSSRRHKLVASAVLHPKEEGVQRVDPREVGGNNGVDSRCVDRDHRAGNVELDDPN